MRESECHRGDVGISEATNEIFQLKADTAHQFHGTRVKDAGDAEFFFDYSAELGIRDNQSLTVNVLSEKLLEVLAHL